MSVADAIRSGSTDSEEEQGRPDYDYEDDDESMFVPEDEPASGSADSPQFGSSLNPMASSFTPTFGQGTTLSPFGKPATESPFGKSTGNGGSSNDASIQPRTASTFGKAARPLSRPCHCGR